MSKNRERMSINNYSISDFPLKEFSSGRQHWKVKAAATAQALLCVCVSACVCACVSTHACKCVLERHRRCRQRPPWGSIQCLWAPRTHTVLWPTFPPDPTHIPSRTRTQTHLCCRFCLLASILSSPYLNAALPARPLLSIFTHDTYTKHATLRGRADLGRQCRRGL